MPTSVDEYAPYDAGPGADTQEATWRSFMMRVMADGIFSGALNEFAVFADSTGMQVKVPSGECWIVGAWGKSTSQKTIAIGSSAGIGGGQSRKDRVILRNDFVNNRIEIDVLQGTPAGSPTVPSLTQNSLKWEIALATVTINQSDSTLTAGDVVDERRLIGEIQTVKRPVFKVERTSTLSVANATDLVITWQAATDDNSAMWSAGSPTLVTIKQAGFWVVNAQLPYLAASATGIRGGNILLNSTTPSSGSIGTMVIPTTDQQPTLNFSAFRRFNVGDVLRLNTYQDSGASRTLNTQYGGTFLAGTYLGP